jgi:large subunit ribosomal protein L29
MRIDEIRELSDEDIRKQLDNTLRELMNLRFRNASRQLANNAQIGQARRTVARLRTVAREREIQGITL